MSLTPKQEKFAQLLHSTGNQREAYRQAYNSYKMDDNAASVEAHRISQHPAVAARLAELQKSSQKRNNTTVDTLDAMYKEAWRIGKEISNPSAMVSAASGLAKLHGLNAPDKQDVKHSGEITSITRRIVRHES